MKAMIIRLITVTTLLTLLIATATYPQTRPVKLSSIPEFAELVQEVKQFNARTKQDLIKINSLIDKLPPDESIRANKTFIDYTTSELDILKISNDRVMMGVEGYDQFLTKQRFDANGKLIH